MTNRKRTPWQEKIHALQIKLGIGAEKGTFCCEFFDACDRSVGHGISKGRKGDWAYVGCQYGEASVGGKPARVLFVGMDRPSKGERGECVFLEYGATQEDWRTSARLRRNPHMGGTDVVLEYLVEDGTRPDDRCEQFALANSVFCGPPANQGKTKKTNTSKVSGTMQKNCLNHIRRLIQALEPDIVIAQGSAPMDGLRKLLRDGGDPGRRGGDLGYWENDRPDRQYRRVELVRGQVEGGKPALFLLAGHPAHYPGFAWKSGKLPGELERGLARVREEYAGAA